jgi:hypothetical protein
MQQGYSAPIQTQQYMQAPQVAYICVYIYMHILIYLRACSANSEYACMHLGSVYACTYKYIYIYMYIYIYIYMSIHG